MLVNRKHLTPFRRDRGFKQMEEERRNLSERISNGQGKAPSTGPRGFIIGTFVQGAGWRAPAFKGPFFGEQWRAEGMEHLKWL